MNVRSVVVAMVLWMMSSGFAHSSADKAKEQAEVRKAGQDALAALYKAAAVGARKAVESAAGLRRVQQLRYEDTSSPAAARARASRSTTRPRRSTYMKMAEVQAGLGFGAKKFQIVWLFENDAALNDFINSGWEFGGQATAAAKAGDKGAAYQGAVAVSPGVWLYQVDRQRSGSRAHRQGNQVLQG